MGEVLYPNFPDRKGERLCNLKIEVTKIVLGIISEHCHKNNINPDSIGNRIKSEIYRGFIFPLVDKIDNYEGNDVISFEQRVRHNLIFMKSKILYILKINTNGKLIQFKQENVTIQ